MTRFVFTVVVRIAFFAALVAIADYFAANLFAETIVENKIFALKFIFEILLFDLMDILNNTAFEMKNFFESVV